MALACPITLGIVPIPRRSYISVGTFHTDIFKYTTAMNSSYVMVGTLTTLDALGTGTASNCPVNRVLRENGRTLTPDANPVSTLVKSSAAGGTVALTLNALLVGVYDSVSGLNGFIDPNSAKFQMYNGSRANYVPDSVNPVSLAKDSLVRSATVVAVTPLTTGPTNVDGTLAQTFTMTSPALTGNLASGITPAAALAAGSLVNLTCTVPPAGSFVNLIVSNAAATQSVPLTVNFSTGFRESAPLITAGAGGATVATPGDIFVMSFISNGTVLIELSRSGVDTAGTVLTQPQMAAISTAEGAAGDIGTGPTTASGAT